LLHNAPPSLVPQGFQHSNARCLLRHGLSFCTGHAGASSQTAIPASPAVTPSSVWPRSAVVERRFVCWS